MSPAEWIIKVKGKDTFEYLTANSVDILTLILYMQEYGDYINSKTKIKYLSLIDM